MAITANAFFVAHRLRDCLSQSDAHIFYGVVSVDMQIASGFDTEVDQTVTRDLIQHVVKKAGKVDDDELVKKEKDEAIRDEVIRETVIREIVIRETVEEKEVNKYI